MFSLVIDLLLFFPFAQCVLYTTLVHYFPFALFTFLHSLPFFVLFSSSVRFFQKSLAASDYVVVGRRVPVVALDYALY